jgi:hypothetical protein
MNAVAKKSNHANPTIKSYALLYGNSEPGITDAEILIIANWREDNAFGRHAIESDCLDTETQQ